MDLCVTLIDDFKKNTVKELNKKGLTVIDQDGNPVSNAEQVLGDWSKVVKNRRYKPEVGYTCAARVWNDGYSGRCSKIKQSDSDYCAQHQNHIVNYGRLIYGRHDKEPETVYPSSFKGRRAGTLIQWKGSYKKQTLSNKASLKKASLPKAASPKKASSPKKAVSPKKASSPKKAASSPKKASSKAKILTLKKSSISRRTEKSAAVKALQAKVRGKKDRRSFKKKKKAVNIIEKFFKQRKTKKGKK